MKKPELHQALINAHEELISHVSSLSDDQFEFNCGGEKWNAGQELLHIIKSVKAVNKALSMPKFALRVTFGSSNRPTRSFEEVVDKYKAIVNNRNLVTTPPFEPELISVADRESLIVKLRDKVSELWIKLDKFTEDELDKYVLPHPLLGKMPLREVGYFTIYHAGHHLRNNKRNLKSMAAA